MKNNNFYHFYIRVSLSSLFHIASIHFLNVHHTFAWYSPYISLMFTLHFHNIIMMRIPSLFHLCFPPSVFSYYQKPYSCRHFIVELFIGKWIHAIYLSRTFLQSAIKPIPTIPSLTTATHVAISFPTRQDMLDPLLPPVVPSHNSPTCSKDWVITTPFSTSETVKTQ